MLGCAIAKQVAKNTNKQKRCIGVQEVEKTLQCRQIFGNSERKSKCGNTNQALAYYAKAESQKAILQHDQYPNTGQQSQNRQIHMITLKILQHMNPTMTIENKAVISLASILKYFAMEILEISGIEARDIEKNYTILSHGTGMFER